MSASKKKKLPPWVSELEEKTGETGFSEKMPFAILKNIPGLTPIIDTKKGNEDKIIINEGDTVDYLHIIAKGVMGIGDLIIRGTEDAAIEYWVERKTIGEGCLLGELELPIDVHMFGEDYSFCETTAQQSAWPSSEALKWLVAYKDSERKAMAEDVVLVKIPRNSIPALMKVSEFRNYAFFDQFRKARGYFLDIERNVRLSKQKDTDTAKYNYNGFKEACKSRFLYEQRKAVGCVIGDTVYIFGKERLGILIDSTSLPKKEFLESIKEMAKMHYNFEIVKIKATSEFMEGLPEPFKDRFVLRSRRRTQTNDNKKVVLVQGSDIFCLKPINSVS